MAVPSSTTRRRPSGEPQQLGDVGRTGGAEQRPVVAQPRARSMARAWNSAARAGSARVASSRRASERGGIAARGYRPPRCTDQAPAPSTPASPRGEQGQPLLPGPTLAAPFHLRGDPETLEYTYGRDHNPTWTHLERAIGELDGGRCVVFPSGMAAMTAVLMSRLRSGDTLVACGDGYPVLRELARGPLDGARGEDAARAERHRGARRGRRRRRARVDGDALEPAAGRRRHRGGRARPRTPPGALLGGRQHRRHAARAAAARPRRRLRDALGHQGLSGHSDMLLGAVSVTEPERAAGAACAGAPSPGSILGGFEAWLAHRSLATLGLRLERSSANAAALAAMLRARDDLVEVVHPSGPVAERQMAFTGPLVGFDPGAASGRRRSSTRARLSPRRQASAACTPPPSGAPGGAPTRSRRASSASRRGARTRRTCSPTSRGALDAV